MEKLTYDKIIEYYVEQIFKELYGLNDNKPKYIISNLQDKFVLTITYLGKSFSDFIDDKTDLKRLIEDLYNNCSKHFKL